MRHLTADRGAPFDLAFREIGADGLAITTEGRSFTFDLFDRYPDPASPERIPATTGPDGWIFVHVDSIAMWDAETYTYRVTDAATLTPLLTGRLTIRRPENV